MKHIVDLMLTVKAQAYLVEGANACRSHPQIAWAKLDSLVRGARLAAAG